MSEVGSTFLAVFRWLTGWRKPVDPCWEVIPAKEGAEVIGYLVRWSEPDHIGRYLWVGHYFAGETASIEWCEVAAKRDAERKNREKVCPWEFPAFAPNIK